MDGLIITCDSCGKKNRVPHKKQHLRPRCGTCQAPLTIGEAAVPVSLGDHDFENFIATTTVPVLVDFFSPGCGPCRALAPLIEECAGRYLGRVVIASVDTSRHPGVAGRCRIRAVPTLIMYRNGSEIDRIVGAPQQQDLISRLDILSR